MDRLLLVRRATATRTLFDFRGGPVNLSRDARGKIAAGGLPAPRLVAATTPGRAITREDIFALATHPYAAEAVERFCQVGVSPPRTIG